MVEHLAGHLEVRVSISLETKKYIYVIIKNFKSDCTNFPRELREGCLVWRHLMIALETAMFFIII